MSAFQAEADLDRVRDFAAATALRMIASSATEE